MAPQLGLVYAAAIWGSTFFVVKGVLAHVDPAILVAYRFTLAAALLAIWAAWRRQPLLGNLRAGLTLGAILGVLYLAQTVGLVYTKASNSGFITGLFIVFVPLVGWLLYRQRPLKRHLAAIGIALVGLWLLTGGIAGVNRGDLITLFSALTYALHVLLADQYMRARLDPVVLCFQQVAVTAAFGWVAALVLQRPLAALDASVWWVIAFLAVFPTVSAFVIQLVAQRVVDPTRTSLIFTLEPVFAAGFAWTLGGEGLVPLSALGGLLIVAAMLLSDIEWRVLLGRKPAI